MAFVPEARDWSTMPQTAREILWLLASVGVAVIGYIALLHFGYKVETAESMALVYVSVQLACVVSSRFFDMRNIQRGFTLQPRVRVLLVSIGMLLLAAALHVAMRRLGATELQAVSVAGSLAGAGVLNSIQSAYMESKWRTARRSNSLTDARSAECQRV